MKIVLGTTDLLEILSLHLGKELSPEQVSVRTTPVFEIEVEGALAFKELLPQRASTAAIARPVRTETAEPVQENEPDGGMSMRDLLAYSRQIEEGIQTMPRR